MPRTVSVEQPDQPTLRIAYPRWMARLADPVLVLGSLLVAVSLALRVPVLRSAYFIEDDLLFVGDAYEHELTFDFLFRIHKGHLMPGALALTWAESRIAAYDWTLVASVTFALHALVAVLLFRLLWKMFGPRAGILLPLAVYLFSPLTIPAFSWWSAAINAVPLQLALVLALSAQLRHARGEGSRHGWTALAWVVFGMAFSTKGVFVPLLLFAFTTAFLRAARPGGALDVPVVPDAPRPPGARRHEQPVRRGQDGWLGSMGRELREHWQVWTAHVLLMGGYTALYLSRQYTAPGEGAALPKTDVATDLAGTLLGRTLPSGLIGGPLSWGPVPSTGGVADPSALLVAVSWTVIAALVLVTLFHRRHAARAWVIVAAYAVVVDAVPTVIARGTALGLVGAETRYVADAVVVFAVCLGAALLPLRGEPDPYRRTVPPGSAVPVVAGLTAGAFLVMSVVSVENYRQTLSGDRVRAYLGNARAALAKAPADTVIFSRPVPESIVLSWNGNRRLTHHLLGPLASPAVRAKMRVPEPTERAMVFDDAGRLVPLSVAPAFAQLPPAGKKCLPTLDGAVYWPEPVAFAGPDQVAGLAYSAKRATSLSVEVSGRSEQLNLRATQAGLLHFPVRTPGKGLLLRVDDPSAGVCLKGFAFGTPVPVNAPAPASPAPKNSPAAPTSTPSAPAATRAPAPSRTPSPKPPATSKPFRSSKPSATPNPSRSSKPSSTSKPSKSSPASKPSGTSSPKASGSSKT
ncbi:ArnT family glycosyltransferase [Sphaerisporangium sp. NPDC004334]